MAMKKFINAATCNFVINKWILELAMVLIVKKMKKTMQGAVDTLKSSPSHTPSMTAGSAKCKIKKYASEITLDSVMDAARSILSLFGNTETANTETGTNFQTNTETGA